MPRVEGSAGRWPAAQARGTATGNARPPSFFDVFIDIDRTAPEAYNQFDPATQNVLVFGRDAGSGVPAGPITSTSVITRKHRSVRPHSRRDPSLR